MSDRYYEEARAVAIACLIRHGQFSPEAAPVAYADGWIEACAECIAAALHAHHCPSCDGHSCEDAR